MIKITEIARLPKSEQFSTCQRYLSQFLLAQIEDLNEDCVQISRSYLLYFPRNKSSNSVTVGPVNRFK